MNAESTTPRTAAYEPREHEVKQNVENDQRRSGEYDFQREGEVYLLPRRVDAVEQKQAESEERDKHYKERQLALDGKLVRLTTWLVIVGLLGTGLALWQSVIAKQAANAAQSAANTANRATQIAEQTLASGNESFGQTLAQMEAQSKAMQKAAVAAEQGAKATISSNAISGRGVAITEESLRLTREVLERPYVFLTGST